MTPERILEIIKDTILATDKRQYMDAAKALHAALLAEQAQPVAGGAVCECGHRLERHTRGGCVVGWGTPDFCMCKLGNLEILLSAQRLAAQAHLEKMAMEVEQVELQLKAAFGGLDYWRTSKKRKELLYKEIARVVVRETKLATVRALGIELEVSE